MLLAIVGTLMQHEIIDYRWIAVGLVVGTVIGIPLGTRVPMTAMPQRIAISHTFGALAATLVGDRGVLHDHTATTIGARPTMAALGFEVMFGSLTVTGSFVAFGKLQEILPGRPITYRGQNAVNIALLRLVDSGRARRRRRRPERRAAVLRDGRARAPRSACCSCCRSAARTCRS